MLALAVVDDRVDEFVGKRGWIRRTDGGAQLDSRKPATHAQVGLTDPIHGSGMVGDPLDRAHKWECLRYASGIDCDNAPHNVSVADGGFEGDPSPKRQSA